MRGLQVRRAGARLQVRSALRASLQEREPSGSRFFIQLEIPIAAGRPRFLQPAGGRRTRSVAQRREPAARRCRANPAVAQRRDPAARRCRANPAVAQRGEPARTTTS
jgi:hypothetical protein